MPKELLIIFVKNIKFGKVKTRLAKTIGAKDAFKVYQTLVSITEKATYNLDVQKQIYFSEEIDATLWPNDSKSIQNGKDLGERMLNAFKNGFDLGYDNIVLIGSDLPSISQKIIKDAFIELRKNEVVFGPAEDGGYYLIGLSNFHEIIFKNKPWSQANLLKDSLFELRTNKIEVSLMETLNDIDTFEDLKQYPKLLNLVN